MEHMDFVKRYDCQIQYQYAFDGKRKTYYPIISNLHFSDGDLSLKEFAKYPKIDFHSCIFTNITLSLKKIRDINFQQCVIQKLSLRVDEFNGTLGFADSDISLSSITTTNSPQILAIVDCVVLGMRQPCLTGFDQLHTCAIIRSSLDYLNLNVFLGSIVCEQLLITDIEPYIPLVFTLPKSLKSLKLKSISIDTLSVDVDNFVEMLHLEDVIIASTIKFFNLLDKLQQLRELTILHTNLRSLGDLTLDNLEKIQVDYDIHLDEKLLARIKLANISLQRI